jgi:hypothetical protein
MSVANDQYFEPQIGYVHVVLKTVQVNFVVNTGLIQECVYYEIYLISLYYHGSKNE